MHGSGHSEELRTSLKRLEDALARHEPAVRDAASDDKSLDIMRHCVELLRQEAEHIRVLLANG